MSERPKEFLSLISHLVLLFKIWFVCHKQDAKMSSSGEFGNPLRKFKLVFLGEQSGKFRWRFSGSCCVYLWDARVNQSFLLHVESSHLIINYMSLNISTTTISLFLLSVRISLEIIWISAASSPWMDYILVWSLHILYHSFINISVTNSVQ